MELKCSSCSQTVRPVVAVDVDGTLAEYHRPLTNFAARYFNLVLPLGEWDGQGEMEDWLGITKDQWRDLKFAYRSGGFKRFAPMYPGADAFTNYVRKAGCELWITTTRPWLRLDSIDPDTRWWLETHEIGYDHLLYDEHKYRVLSELVYPERVIMVVDDLEDMLVEAVAAFGLGTEYKVERLHNRKPGEYPGFQFSELIIELDRKVSAWHLHGG